MSNKSRQGRKAILGKKLGMTQIFRESGEMVPVTVVLAGPCTVLQVKTDEKDGYSAVQLGFDAVRKKRRRPQQAVLDRLGVEPQRFVREVPFVDPADLEAGSPVKSSDGDEVSEAAAAEPSGGAAAEPSGGAAAEPSGGAAAEPSGGAAAEPSGGAAAGPSGGAAAGVVPGAKLRVSAFKEVTRVDVRGVTKGRGFAGTIKRHGFSAGDHSHGSKNVRDPGSTGMHTDPGRVAKGKKMPGHYGNKWRKAMNLTVVGVEEEENLLLIRGALPGPNGGYLYIEESLV